MTDTLSKQSPADTPDAGSVNYTKQGRVAYITLNRPRVLNAMNRRMHEQLTHAFNEFETDRELLVAVLTGAGQRAFSVGKDLFELAQDIHDGVQPRSFGSRGEPGWPRLTDRFGLGKPLIARVDGYALGGGFELALACDIIVASDRSTFALPEAKLGLIPGAGGLFRLTRHIPFKIAMGHLLTGRTISATRAYELGLVNEVVRATDLDACVDTWVADVLRCSPLSLRSIKQVSEASMHLSIEEAFARRYEAEDYRCSKADCREGPLAYVEKREPVWGLDCEDPNLRLEMNMKQSERP